MTTGSTILHLTTNTMN